MTVNLCLFVSSVEKELEDGRLMGALVLEAVHKAEGLC
jgi:hypothetical protein